MRQGLRHALLHPRKDEHDLHHSQPWIAAFNNLQLFAYTAFLKQVHRTPGTYTAMLDRADRGGLLLFLLLQNLSGTKSSWAWLFKCHKDDLKPHWNRLTRRKNSL